MVGMVCVRVCVYVYVYVYMWMVALACAVHVVPAHGCGSHEHQHQADQQRQLPAQLVLRQARTHAEAQSLLADDGVFTIAPGSVSAGTVARLDAWLVKHAGSLPPFTVKMPVNRQHPLLMPGDCNGDVAAAVASGVKAIGMQCSVMFCSIGMQWRRA